MAGRGGWIRWLVAGMALLLTGCFIPEDFSATVLVHRDGGCEFRYEGVLAFGPALHDLARQGSLDAEDNQHLHEVAEALRHDQGFIEVRDLGEARYFVRFARSVSPGESFWFPGRDSRFFQILPGRSGSLVFSTLSAQPEEIRQLDALGAHVSGILRVIVPEEVRVIRQNAQRRPSHLSGPAYEWEITSPADPVEMVLQPRS